jgi:glycerophosphoryl diester phosphodiesterase
LRRRDLLLGAGALAGCVSMNEIARTRPIIIAHRGASAYRPEHTLGAYRLAIAQGADYIEPDLVMTKDGVLVCRHENELSAATNVADHPEFADRRKEKTVDGVTSAGWWAEDFTLAELKTLRCRERIPQLRPANIDYNDQEPIPTFQDVLALAAEAGVGVYPELKHPSYLRERGLDPAPALIAAVREAGGQPVADRLFVQCFEVGPLVQLAQMSSIRWRCIQLIGATGGPMDRRDLSYADMLRGDGLQRIAEYARGVGPEKSLIIPRDANNNLAAPTDLAARAHAANLQVHPWTFRPENYFLPAALRAYRSAQRRPEDAAEHGDMGAEMRALARAGVDGFFTDAPDAALAALA